MADQEKNLGAGAFDSSGEDADFNFVLVQRAKKKIPEFDSAEEINLVPYMDVMVNLVIFMLVAMATAAPLGILSIFPPSSGEAGAGGAPDEPPPVPFTVAITEKGFMLKGKAELGLGADGGTPATISKKPDGKFDFDGLTQRAVQIKEKLPNEGQVVIVADGNITYDILIQTMDALRNEKDKILFPNVQLSPGIQ